MGNYLVTEDGMRTLDDMKDRLDALSPFTNHNLQQPQSDVGDKSASPIRGYMMQPISRGNSGLCALVSRRPEYRTWKIDVAGIIYTDATESRFQLRFTRDGDPWFDTDVLTVGDCTIQDLIGAISNGSATGASLPVFPRQSMIGCLGNPTQATNLVINDDLYPELPSNYKIGDMIDARIGSWIFSIHRNALPQNVDYDIDLLFTLSGDPLVEPVELNGPAVMTLEEIKDTPTGEFRIVTDVLDLPNPSPIQGGSKVVALPMPDVGYGIVAAYPRDLLMEQASP
jgi:hypothetical protein